MSDTKLIQLILDKVTTIDNKVDALDKKLTNQITDLDKKLTKRIDTIGLQVANLEDDAPTIEEFNGLEKRVSKLEKISFPN
jgi:hypothetical protein